MFKPEMEQFVPTKYKFIKGTGFRVEWNTPNQKGESIKNDGFHKESPSMPHPDLLNLFNELQEPVKTILNVKIEPLTENEEALGRTRPTFTIDQVLISGEDGDEAAKFSCVQRHKNGQKSSMTTAFIKLQKDETGTEMEPKLWAILENIRNEAYEYAINEKYAQLSMFGNDTEEEKEDDSDLDNE